jgi:hypothetical protein
MPSVVNSDHMEVNSRAKTEQSCKVIYSGPGLLLGLFTKTSRVLL